MLFISWHIVIVDVDGLREDVLYGTDPNKFEAYISKKYPTISKIVLGEGSQNFNYTKFDNTINVFPSYTFPTQASIFTGRWPGGKNGHGIMGNSWLYRKSSSTNGLFADRKEYTGATETGLLELLKKTTIWGLDANRVYTEGLANMDLKGKTIYDYLTDKSGTSVVAFNMYSKGATKWIEPSLHTRLLISGKDKDKALRLDPQRSDSGKYDNFMMLGKPMGAQYGLLSYLNSNCAPNLTTVYFAGLDHYSHSNKIVSQQQYLSEVVDILLEALVDKLKSQQVYNNTIFIFTSDHGQRDVEENKAVGYIDLKEAIEDTTLYKFGFAPPQDYPLAWFGLNGGMANIYLQNRGTYPMTNWKSMPRYDEDTLTLAKKLLDNINNLSGTYRAYVAAIDENNITLINKDGSKIEAYYNFTIQ